MTKKDQQIVTEPTGKLQVPEKMNPKMKPFTGKLTRLRIQPDKQRDLKPVLKLENIHSKSSKTVKIKTEPIDTFSNISQPLKFAPDIKPKLEPFTGNVQSLPIWPVELLHNIKPQRRQKKFTCDLCQKGVGTKGGLLYHMKAHINGRLFKCGICKLSYSTKNDFDTHNQRHSGKVFTCDYCNKTFLTKQYVADHISGLHLPKVLKCVYCKRDRYFSTLKSMRFHVATTHFKAIDSKRPVYSCKMCGHATVSRYQFERHRKISRLMRFQCKICLKKFPCRNIFSEHRRIENNSLVECKICKDSFKNIRNHMRYHHYKTLVCEFCKYSSTCSTKFFTHTKQCASQDMLRPKGHLCVECNIYFYGERSLKIHNSKIHGALNCRICPARFENTRRFRIHMQKHKKNPIRCLCSKFPMFPNMKAFYSHFNPEHSNMRLTKAFYGLCLICWEGNKKKVACQCKTDLEEHMLMFHFKRQPQKIVTITFDW
jgi:hypothetical protein